MTETGKKIPDFKPGDIVKIHVRVVEGESERLQVLEGMVLRRRGSGISETFTVRKNSFGVGVERTFPLQSPRVERIEVVKANKVRRAKLYYMRKLTGKAARLEEVAGPAEAGAPSAVAAPAADAAPKKHAGPAAVAAPVTAPAS